MTDTPPSDLPRSAPLLGNAVQVIETTATAADEPRSFQAAVEEVGAGTELGHRLKQQAILSDFGLYALTRHDLDDLLHQACTLCARGMQTGLCKVLQLEESGTLFIRAGVGWKPGVVGNARIGADVESPAGFALKTGMPVISNHLEKEERFRTPRVMADHGVRRAVNVLINTSSGAWGVLEVDSSNSGKFEAADIAFLQGFANLIGVAIGRQAADAALAQALEHQQMLVREASHRVKNSLALLSSVLNLQSRVAQSVDVAEALDDASGRISAIAQAHDQIWRRPAEEAVDLAALINSLGESLDHQLPQIELECRADNLLIKADAAVALALFLSEAATNAAKHAYPAPGGAVHIDAAYDGARIVVAVRDFGVGFPPGFNPDAASQTSLGMRLIRSLARQLRGELTYYSEGGVTVSLLLPAALSMDTTASA